MWNRTRILAHVVLLAAAAAGGAGCEAAFDAPLGLWQRPPTARITQSDVVALNEAVEMAANLRYDEAERGLASLLPRFEAAAEKEYAAETMFWMAYCYEKTGRKEDAAAFYDHLLSKYPQARAAEWAGIRRARIEFKRPGG